MATHALVENAVKQEAWTLSCLGTFPGMRVLAWRGDILYASNRYELWQARIEPSAPIEWNFVARYRPPTWRNITSRSPLGFRLVRDGVHALALPAPGQIVAAVPGAIVTLLPGDQEFRISHRIMRGTRPLHITALPVGKIYWGEYFDNPRRDEVHIYGSSDHGATWQVAYTFRKGSIRHVHNIVYDKWQDCLWILTGDIGHECRILRASADFRTVETVLSGTQQTRAATAIPSKDGLYFSSDTPLERNFVYLLDHSGRVNELEEICGSSIYACEVGSQMFLSTMVEPSVMNAGRKICVYRSREGAGWRELLQWEKDRWPMKFFQYGNAVFPDGCNETGILALTTIATRDCDQQMSLWRV